MSRYFDESRGHQAKSLPGEILLYVEMGYAAKERGEVDVAREHFQTALSQIQGRLEDPQSDFVSDDTEKLETLNHLLTTQKVRLEEEIDQLSTS